MLTFLSTNGGTNWYGFATGGAAVTVKDEGVSLATAASSIDFVGRWIAATGTGAAKTVTVTVHEPLTSGSAAAPELVFTADGRCIMTPVSD